MNKKQLTTACLFMLVMLFLAAVVNCHGCLSKKRTITPITPNYKTTGAVCVFGESQDEHDFRLICLQEGHGRIITNPNDKYAYNKKEDAVGPAQLRPCFLKDANEWRMQHKLNPFTHKQCYGYEESFAVCKAYWARYKFGTLEQRARGHCGGPDGPRQYCTVSYYNELLIRDK